MPRDPGQPGAPEEWLRRAKSNLALARQAKSDEIYCPSSPLHAFSCLSDQEKAARLFEKITISLHH